MPVRIEHNRMHYTQIATDTTFCRNTTMFTPRITFQKASVNRSTHYEFNMEYSLNMSAPAMLHLVRRTDNSNPLHIVQSGKPLKNELKHDLLVNYRSNLQKQCMYNLNAGVTVKQNTLTMESIYDRTTGVRTVSPGTINGNWDAGIGGSFSMPLDKAKKITLENNNSMGYDNSVDRIGTEKTNGTVRSVVKTAYYNGTLKLNYRPTDKFTINAVGNIHLRNSYSDIEDFTTIKARDFDYGLAFSAQLPYKFQISTDITMYSRRGYNDSNMNTDDFVWNARLTRTFIKGSLVCMLDGFDILGQLSNIRRTLNAQARVETWYNVTPRYIMLHVAYRFNKQPKKN
nr:outer membrane beta-barrel protein [Xylanibacter muris]